MFPLHSFEFIGSKQISHLQNLVLNLFFLSRRVKNSPWSVGLWFSFARQNSRAPEFFRSSTNNYMFFSNPRRVLFAMVSFQASDTMLGTLLKQKSQTDIPSFNTQDLWTPITRGINYHFLLGVANALPFLFLLICFVITQFCHMLSYI